MKPEFVAWRFRMADGRTVQGYKRSETAAQIDVFDPTTQKTESLAKSEIEEQAKRARSCRMAWPPP